MMIDIVVYKAPHKLDHEIIEQQIRINFGKRLEDAGWWAIHLQHNRLCRLFGIACEEASGSKEIAGQLSIIEEYLKEKFPGLKIELKRRIPCPSSERNPWS